MDEQKKKRSPEFEKAREEMWAWSIDAWTQSGRVTTWLWDEINGLHDSDGEPLPDAAKLFMVGVLLRAYKPGKRKYLPKKLIRAVYQQELKPGNSKQVKAKLAERWATSIDNIDQIVNPRASRQPGKPRKS